MSGPQIKYSYNEVPTIRDFSRSDAFIRGLIGPFRSGKSSGCAIEVIRRGLGQQPSTVDGVKRSRWMIVRNTYGELRDTTIKTFHQWFPPRLFGEWTDYKHEYKITAFENTEIEILFRALDRPDHMSKLLSLELTGCWVNEAREVPWPVIEAIQGRVGQFPPKREGGPTWSGLILDTNPPDVDSDWYRFFEDEQHPEEFRKIFRQPSGLSEEAENIENLPNGKEYYERLSIGKSTTWTNVYIHGKYDFVTDGKPVYDDYSDELHCKECQSIIDIPIFVGLDFGLTPAATYSQMTPSGHWLILDELNATGMGIDRFSDEMLVHQTIHFPGRDFIYVGDPAGNHRSQTDEKTCFEILQAKGIPIEPGMQTLNLRMECVRKPLRTLIGGRPQLVLHPRCKGLRRGFLGGYQFRRMQISGTNRFTEVPDKNRYSHCTPAGVLISTKHGRIPIEDIRIGDYVATPLGYRRVTATMNSLALELIDLKFSNGAKLTCTPDHPIFTNEGCFVRADALQYNDIVFAEDEQWADKQKIPLSNLMEKDITYGKMDTTDQLARKTLYVYITETCGNTITDLYQKGAVFTIRIITKQITKLKIWNCLLFQRIHQCTEKKECLQVLSKLKLIWMQLGHLLVNGMAPKKALSGINKMALNQPKTEKLSSISVLNAAKLIRLNEDIVKKERIKVSVVGDAKHVLGTDQKLMTKLEPVQNVELNSQLINILRSGSVANPVRVKRIVNTYSTNTLVYDLTVEEAHCFYANGILTSNCHDALQYAATRIFGHGLLGFFDTSKDDDEEDYNLNYTRNKVTGY